MNMMEFDFEKFKSICNDRYIVMHIASENQLKQFIGSVCDNNTRWHPLVGDTDAHYVYYVREYVDEFGLDHGDVVYAVFDELVERYPDITTVHAFQDFLRPAQEFDLSAVLEFMEDK